MLKIIQTSTENN